MAQTLTCLALPAPACVRHGVFPDASPPALPPGLAAHLPQTGAVLWPAESCPAGRTGQFHPTPALRTAAMGEWQGRALKDMPATDLERWVSDPDFAPPGGESRSMLMQRVAAWLAELPPAPRHLTALADATVIRAIVIAALGGTAAMLPRLDIAPHSRTVLTRHAMWRVSSTGTPLAASL